MRGRNPDNPSERAKSNGNYSQRIELNKGGVSNTITTVSKDFLLIEPQILRRKRTEEEKLRRHIHGDKGAKFSQGREYEPADDGVCNTISTVTKDNYLMEEKKLKYRIRKLTPRECFRLMDMPEENIDKIQAAGISESQQYKLAGNSIVVSCMFYIFENLFINNEKPEGLLF